MSEAPFDIDFLRVAQPCPMAWDAMQGDDRQRHCSACDLNVYNVASMTSDEVRALVGSQERTCMRLFRRADGTVLTQDCPVGLRARIKRRVAGYASAIAGAVMSACGLLASSASGPQATTLRSAAQSEDRAQELAAAWRAEPLTPVFEGLPEHNPVGDSSATFVLDGAVRPDEPTGTPPHDLPSTLEIVPSGEWVYTVHDGGLEIPVMPTLGVVVMDLPDPESEVLVPDPPRDPARRTYIAPAPPQPAKRGTRWERLPIFGRIFQARG